MIFRSKKPKIVESRYETLDKKMVLSSTESFFGHFIDKLNEYERINFEVKDNKLISVSPKTESSIFVIPVYTEEGDKEVKLSINQVLNPLRPRCVYNLQDRSSRIEWISGYKFNEQKVKNCVGLSNGHERLFDNLKPELGNIKGNCYDHIDRIVEVYFNSIKE